jgi:dTDP-4-amino-4,6-dideoxygalactose transaminase
MKVPYIDLKSHFSENDLQERIKSVFQSCHFVMGPAVEQFENAFAKLCGTQYAIGLNSGTDAIFLGLKALGIGEGDEVITALNSFIATAGAIVAVGAKPVFVDVNEDYNIDPDSIERAINSNTKAIIPVHLTGNMADMPRIMQIASHHNLSVIEDAAQSVLADINGIRSGAYGDIGCFSLHPLKNLNVCGDGGMSTTDSEEIYRKLVKLRNHGLKNRDEIDFFGYNSRLDTIQAIVGLWVIENIEEITQKRNHNARIYDRKLMELKEFVTIPERKPDHFQVFHTYVIQVDRREKLIAFLADHNIETKIHYPLPIHYQKPCLELGYKRGDFPRCEKQAERILTLPVHQYLTMDQILYVCKTIDKFYKNR